MDARLDEPTQLFEKITNQLMDASSPLIVVDAWDALRELAPNEPLEADMRVLLAWCERANAKLVVTSEDPKDTSLDSLVDAVVTLDQKNPAGGTGPGASDSEASRRRDTLPVLLVHPEGGRVSLLRAIQARGVRRCVISEEEASDQYASSRRFSTGFKELDDLLEGGFRAGTLVGIELSPAVDPRILLLMLGNVVADFARSNRPARLGSD